MMDGTYVSSRSRLLSRIQSDLAPIGNYSADNVYLFDGWHLCLGTFVSPFVEAGQ